MDGDNLTVLEGGQTRREGAVVVSPSLLARTLFRGCVILEQLPTRGTEADVYLVEVEGVLSILKLYRHSLEPKLEVLTRINEISRLYSQCFVVFKDSGFDEQTGRWFELQEYFPLGSLKDVPATTKKQIPFAKKLVAELSDAIHCLHSNEIIHCDIKPGNVLIRSMEPLDAVLTDFGISSLLALDHSHKMTSLKGTPMYWAPEAFSRMVGRPADWWGLGIIILELLVGTHPMEGLSESQIIYKLTLGNIKIPDSLDANFELLLRGLLTKDDTKRWGRSEVSRWLAGDRNIPAYYEQPEVLTLPLHESSKPSFPFEGQEYRTAAELARAFCENKKPWYSATGYLNYVRQWFESLMMFEEALEIGNWLGSMEPDHALFCFIYTHSNCPFAYMGKRIDTENLRLFLGRTARMEGGDSEGQISVMMGDGRLLWLYNEYVRLTGNQDALLGNVLLVMNGKSPAEQWICFEALYNPKEYLWPEGVAFSNVHHEQNKTAELILGLQTLPFKRDAIETLTVRYVLPKCLLNLLKTRGTYAEGAEKLRDLQKQALLIPWAADSLEASNAALSYAEYVENARAICMGHTPAMLARLGSVIDNLKVLPTSSNPSENTAFSRAIFYFSGLSDRKIESLDVLAIGRVAKLLDERGMIMRQLPQMLPIAGIVGAVLMWGMSVLNRDGILPWLRVLFVGGCFLSGSYFIFKTNFLWIADTIHDGYLDGDLFRRTRTPALQIMPFAALFVGALLLFGRLADRFPMTLAFFIGGCLGCLVYFPFNLYALNLNYRKIAGACSESVRTPN